MRSFKISLVQDGPIIIIIIIISNIYTGLLVQDRDPVISQGPVERKGMK